MSSPLSNKDIDDPPDQTTQKAPDINTKTEKDSTENTTPSSTNFASQQNGNAFDPASTGYLAALRHRPNRGERKKAGVSDHLSEIRSHVMKDYYRRIKPPAPGPDWYPAFLKDDPSSQKLPPLRSLQPQVPPKDTKSEASYYSVACLECRKRNVECSGERTGCDACLVFQSSCKYPTEPPVESTIGPGLPIDEPSDNATRTRCTPTSLDDEGIEILDGIKGTKEIPKPFEAKTRQPPSLLYGSVTRHRVDWDGISKDMIRKLDKKSEALTNPKLTQLSIPRKTSNTIDLLPTQSRADKQAKGQANQIAEANPHSTMKDRKEDHILLMLHRWCVLPTIKLCRQTSPLGQAPKHIRCACDALKLWAADYGVLFGGLDKALVEFKDLKTDILQILVHIFNMLNKDLKQRAQLADNSATLGEITRIHNESRRILSSSHDSNLDDDDSHDEDGTPSEDKPDDISEELELYVQCLVDLGPAIDVAMETKVV